MKRSRLLTVLMALIAAVFTAGAADNATAIMQRCAAKFSNAPSVTVNFAIAHSSGADNGTLIMSKKMFKISSPDLSIWFDGTTQWTYMASSKEVNITEPTGEELMESNPFEVISSFGSHFRCRQLKSSPGSDIIELTPGSAGMTIRSAKITISKSTGWPTAMVIAFDGGNTLSVSINKVTVGAAMQAKQFKFDGKAYPGVEIVDLR